MNLQKSMSQFIKDTKILEKKYQKVDNLQDKTECQKYKVSAIEIAKLAPANFSILISAKFRNRNLSKAIAFEKFVFSHFLLWSFFKCLRNYCI